jgi:hypothetical protein
MNCVWVKSVFFLCFCMVFAASATAREVAMYLLHGEVWLIHCAA